LLIDEPIGLPSTLLREYLKDASDIIRPIDPAPTTKKRMLLKMNGGYEQLLSHPGCDIHCDALLEVGRVGGGAREWEGGVKGHAIQRHSFVYFVIEIEEGTYLVIRITRYVPSSYHYGSNTVYI